MSRTLPRTNAKGHDIAVSDDGAHYANEYFVLNFQAGDIPRHGVRNGAFEEEILAVLIDRMEATGEPAIAEKLSKVLELLVPQPFVPEVPATAAPATESTEEHDA